mmetsp:Transcript_44580/g.129642  ORF Transcript_44580/g.129642 Transcript_44580/m.129642 type:complete len:232 (+) Transcript_44580:1921-2616(+)
MADWPQQSVPEGRVAGPPREVHRRSIEELRRAHPAQVPRLPRAEALPGHPRLLRQDAGLPPDLEGAGEVQGSAAAACGVRGRAGRLAHVLRSGRLRAAPGRRAAHPAGLPGLEHAAPRREAQGQDGRRPHPEDARGGGAEGGPRGGQARGCGEGEGLGGDAAAARHGARARAGGGQEALREPGQGLRAAGGGEAAGPAAARWRAARRGARRLAPGERALADGVVREAVGGI